MFGNLSAWIRRMAYETAYNIDAFIETEIFFFFFKSPTQTKRIAVNASNTVYILFLDFGREIEVVILRVVYMYNAKNYYFRRTGENRKYYILFKTKYYYYVHCARIFIRILMAVIA